MSNNESCKHGAISPVSLLESLHDSQAGRGRHRCPICAYDQGFNLGSIGKWNTYQEFCDTTNNKEACNDGSFAPADILNNLGNNAIEINDIKYENKKIFKLAYLNDKNGIQTNESEVKFIPLSNVVIHEISHLFLNDFIPKNIEKLSIKKSLFLTTSKNEVLGEKEWKNELDELIVRVCVSKILGQKFGAERELIEIADQSKHYKYFKEMNVFFNNYSQNRTKYKSITEFYPEIIKFIETLK